MKREKFEDIGRHERRKLRTPRLRTHLKELGKEIKLQGKEEKIKGRINTNVFYNGGVG